MALALFDLDDTLISGSSDLLWAEFLCDRKLLADPKEHMRRQRAFLRDYEAGQLEINHYLDLQLAFLRGRTPEELAELRAIFVQERIRPRVRVGGRELVETHRRRGHHLLLITSTNSFLTRPIADDFNIAELIAPEPELLNGRYTGRISGLPAFREGKVLLLRAWLTAHREEGLRDSWFYSDSHNDLPLLSEVGQPVAVNPDPLLRETAQRRGWRLLELPEAETPT